MSEEGIKVPVKQVTSSGKGADDTQRDAALERARSLIQSHEHFPIQGVLFHDIFPIFQDHVASEVVLSRLYAIISSEFHEVDVILGLDSRGFLFGPPLAMRLGCAFAPIRKKGKLPGRCHRASYQKEYGEDHLELQDEAIEEGAVCVLVDDLLATGGTMRAAIEVVRKAGGKPLLAVTVVELPDLRGAEKFDVPHRSLFALESGC